MSKTGGVLIVEKNDYANLYAFLQDAFRVLYISYQTILSHRHMNKYVKKKGTPLENNLTDDLVKQSANVPKRFDYRIQKQQEDFETNAKIDIAILYSLKFGDNSNDLKIECKRLDNIKYLIDEGIRGNEINKSNS